MKSLAIVESFNILKNRGASLSTSDEWSGSGLGLEGGKETLFHGIVRAIATPAHADSYLTLSEQLAVIVTGRFAAPIRMVQQTDGRFSLAQSHLESALNQRGSQMFRHAQPTILRERHPPGLPGKENLPGWQCN